MLKQLFNDIIALLSPFSIQEETVEVPELEAIDKRAATKQRLLEDQEVQAKVYASLMRDIVHSVHTAVNSAYIVNYAMHERDLTKKIGKDPAKYADKVAKNIHDYNYFNQDKANELGAKILKLIIDELPMIEIAQKSYLRGLDNGKK